jgi:hypothetical protein
LNDRGRIARGLRADLLLVDGDPTKDITATRAIAGIWKGGVPFDRAAYVARAAATRATTVAAAPQGSESGDISNFDDGSPAAKFGNPWMPSTDQMAGGKSVGALTVVDGGANGTPKALRIAGTVDAALPYAWSGAAFSPGSAPMQPTNLSAKKAIVFSARGDGKTYRIMLFAQSKGMTPVFKTFQTTGEWQEFSFPFESFGTDAKDIMLFVIAGGPAPGRCGSRQTHPYSSISYISDVPSHPGQCLRWSSMKSVALLSTSSREFPLRIAQPPMTSLDSVKGPSVMVSLPFSMRKRVAAELGLSPPVS